MRRWKRKVLEEHFWWHGFGVRLYFVDPAAGSGRLQQDVWTAPELDAFFPKRRQPIPGPALASFFLKAQPFRENLVLLLDETRENGTEWWQEQFLEESFQDRNGLYLVGGRAGKAEQEFYDWICAQSGLLACVTDDFPVTDGRKTAVVELRQNRKAPVREPAEGSIYLDLTSDAGKQRILREKRTDISYISARNYLDTAFKARYNAF